MILLQLFGLILLTDFIAGVLHWWEDAYGNPNWKFLGKAVVIPNIEHHQFPRKFLQTSTWERIRLSAQISLALGAILWATVGLNWQIIFVLIYGSFGNHLHAMAHRTDAENGKMICLIQKTGLIQSRKMHGIHHTWPYEVNYCVMTNYLNPVLNYIGFWQKLEKIISLFGVNPIRKDTFRNGF